MSWESKTVGSLRQVLKDILVANGEDINLADVKGKKNVVKEITSRGYSYEDLFSNEVIPHFDGEFEEDVIEKNVQNAEEAIKHPVYGSDEWDAYVMSLFHQDELADGKPKIAGLRRVTESLLGEIVFSAPVDYQVQFGKDAYSPSKAVVNYLVKIHFKLDYQGWIPENNIEPNIRTFGAIGAAFPGNTNDGFEVFAEAIAETRAESRALKKALMLKTVTADELCENKAKETVTEKLKKEASGGIEDSQKTVIEMKCNQLGINANIVCQKTLGKDYTDKLSRDEGVQLIKELSKITQNSNLEEYKL